MEQIPTGIRVLLAEDYPTNQKVASIHLRREGYQVDIVENGKLAVEAYKNEHYDVILMDIQMPEMDGYEATRAIREIESARKKDDSRHNRDFSKVSELYQIPIIALTAHAAKGDEEKCRKAGMNCYITKPIRKDTLINAVRKWTMADTSSVHSENENPDVCEQTPDSSKLSNNNSVFDFEKAVIEFDGERDLVLSLLENFIADVRRGIESLTKALGDGNAEFIRKEAHSIKGGAGNLTAMDLAEAARVLEKIGELGDLDHGSEALEGIRNQLDRLHERFVAIVQP